MNILYLGDPSSQSHDFSWMKFFAMKPHNIYLLSRKAKVKKNGHPKIEKYGIKFLGYINDFSLVRPISTLKNFLFLKSTIKRYEIDVFHILYAEPNALWAIFRDYYLCKVGLTTRGSDILISIKKHGLFNNIQDYYVYPLYRMALKKFDFVTCTSNNQKVTIEEITKHRSLPHIIRTGVDIQSIIKPKSNYPSSSDNKKYILFPRNMKPLYYHEFAIRSLKFLPRKIKSSYTFVFLDKDSSDRSYIKLIQKMLDENNDIIYKFLDRQDQESFFDLLTQTALVVMTPKSDGTPVTAMEAMALGIPLILPPIKYDEDIFGDWVFKFKVWNEQELAKLITLVLSYDNSEKINTAKQIIYKKANREKEMYRLLEIYES